MPCIRASERREQHAERCCSAQQPESLFLRFLVFWLCCHGSRLCKFEKLRSCLQRAVRLSGGRSASRWGCWQRCWWTAAWPLGQHRSILFLVPCHRHVLVFQVRSALQAAAAAATAASDAAKPLRTGVESVENLDGVPSSLEPCLL